MPTEMGRVSDHKKLIQNNALSEAVHNRINSYHNLGISRAPLKSQAHQGTSSFRSATTNQRVVHGKLRSDFQWVRGGRVAVKVGVVEIQKVEDQMSQSKFLKR